MNHLAMLKWHRRLGLFAALPVILSSLSGLLHPVMTRMQPEPAKFTFEQHLPALDHALSPKGLFAKNENTTVSDLRIVSWNGRGYYQETFHGLAQRRYTGLADGIFLADGDRAVRHARRFWVWRCSGNPLPREDKRM